MLRAERGHLAGARRGRGGEGGPPAMAVAAASPPPQPGHPRPPARRGLGAARPFPPREPNPISAGPSQTGFMSAGGARVRAAILRCLSPALPFGELSPPPPAAPPPALREETGQAQGGRDPRRRGSRE